jgi:hypothetical protein
MSFGFMYVRYLREVLLLGCHILILWCQKVRVNRYSLSKIPLNVCHTFCRQPYGGRVLCVQRYGNFVLHCMLKIKLVAF